MLSLCSRPASASKPKLKFCPPPPTHSHICNRSTHLTACCGVLTPVFSRKEVRYLILGPETGYPEISHGFPQFFKETSEIVPQSTPRSLPFSTFQFTHDANNLPFDAFMYPCVIEKVNVKVKVSLCFFN
jgi:hypothetical protein